ncbi:MAG TPA: hypothetical protein VHE55_01475 [Fimbriimonadaceae bacterium]|nr:hypothetical protein [Fimbriimonadaceae bacterium]
MRAWVRRWASGRRARRWVAAFCLFVLTALAVDYFAYPYGSLLGGRSSNRGENGLWLRYTWYFSQYSRVEVVELGQRLAREQVRYAYFHVRSVLVDGRLKYRHAESADFNRRLHEADPKICSIAWVYVDGSVDLSNETVRRQMAEEASWLVHTCGFDGVQWDYEPCHSGDAGLLRLLEATRAALPGAFLSVATPTWFPWPVSGAGWTEEYFGEVGKRCDQIAVMCYDTGFVTPRSYAWLVGQQAERVPRAAGKCQVLLGLPTYEAGGRSHNPRAENLKIGLKAVRESDGVAGIALFADYTTDAAEWAWYERAWLGGEGVSR